MNDSDSDSEDCFEDIDDEANNFSTLDVEFKNILNIQENIKIVRKIVCFLENQQLKIIFCKIRYT